MEIGLVSDSPLRIEGLISIFDQIALRNEPRLLAIPGRLQELLARPALEALVLDLQSIPSGLEILEAISRTRPAIRLIVIGPEGNDEMAMESIIAGARAYLELTSDAETVRKAIEVVTTGSIWAPRRLLSKLVDRLLRAPDSSLTSQKPHLTDREQQVLKLILLAHSNREIARQLGIEERTVKAHVGRLMRKTGAENRIELSMRALHRPMTQDTELGGRRRGERRQTLA